jgi:hypothetical protein
MPSTSKKQQRLFGQAWAVRSGALSREDAWPSALKLADSDITDKALHDFAATPHKHLPEKRRKRSKLKRNEGYIMTFESFLHKKIDEENGQSSNSSLLED